MTTFDEAQKAAQAVGKTFVIGVRPLDRGWFANCDGIECDGSTPAMAVKSVVSGLEKRLRDEIAKTDADARSARNSLTDLVG